VVFERQIPVAGNKEREGTVYRWKGSLLDEDATPVEKELVGSRWKRCLL
jgi:hypothetical protein